MRRSIFVVLLMLVAAGCGRKTPPKIGGLGPAPADVAQPTASAADPQAVVGGAMYEGRTAPQWGEVLEGRDNAARMKAGYALSNMGEKGYVELARGLKSTSDEARLASLQAVSRTQLLAHRRDSMTLLLDMIEDRNPMIRQGAAARLSWFEMDSEQALPVLQRHAAKDPDADVRRVCQDSVYAIQEYVKAGGKLTRGVNPQK